MDYHPSARPAYESEKGRALELGLKTARVQVHEAART